MADIIAMFSRLAKLGLLEMFSRVSSFLDESASSSMEQNRRSAMDDFQRIDRMLPRIKVVLEDAEERELQDSSVKLWLLELRLLAYNIDDVVDEYEYEVLRARMESRAVEEAHHCGKRKRGYDDHHDRDGRGEGRNLLVSSSSRVPAISDGMAEKLRKIRERFDEIESDQKALRLREDDGARRSDAPQRSRPTGSLFYESSIFGREGDKKKLMEQLLSDSESSNNIAGNNKITVIPIVGMGGVGKTTLAQLIYNDPKICHHFDLRVWIHVSEDFNLERLTREIYRFIIPREQCSEDLGFDQLQDSIKKELVKFKRTFLVLDDVWNEKQLLWEDFKVPFLDADIVSILTTTRNRNVADVMRTTKFFCLDSLSEEAGWQLFQQCALCDDDKLMQIGRKIIEKCGRLPLAVKILGRHLRLERDEDKWMSILESELWDLDPGKKEILPALRLSYQRMPIHLKPCFRYCAMFPKEKMVNKNFLVWMWMAQGYIQPKIASKTMEEAGREYLDELCERSFFQVIEGKDFVTMHDLIFDLAAFISSEEFIAIKYDGGDKQDICIPKNIRHLAIHRQWTYTNDDCFLLCPFLSSTQFAFRSTFYYDSGLCRIGDFQFSYTVRVLHIQRVTFDSNKSKYIGSIASLKHLRYLHLDIMFNYHEACDMVNLFNSFLNIYNLQVLYLDSFPSQPINLLGSINKLINLRHLILPYGSFIPCGISKLTSLQSLKRVSIKDGGLNEIEGLENLIGSCCIKNLCNITNVESVKKASFNKKKHIWKLMLDWSFSEDYDSTTDVEISFDDYNIPRQQSTELAEIILEALRPHNNLKELELINFHGIRFPLWLGDPSYSKLRHIMLCKCDEWDGSCGLLDRVLPCFQSISISSCAKLKKLKLVQSSSLRSLFVKDCRELSTLHGLHNLCMLKQLDIHGCRKLATITGLQNLHSLEKLKLVQCLKLQLSSDEQLPVMLSTIEVVDCPQLKEWCQKYRFEFIEEVSKIKNHNIHYNEMKLDDCLLSFVSLKALCIDHVKQSDIPKYEWIPCSLNTLHLRSCNDLRFFPLYQNLSALRELIIWDCKALTHLPGIQMMEFLEKLEIVKCPQFMLSPVQRLPSKLQYLLICNCPKLMWLPGLLQLLSLKYLNLHECCELMLLPPEQLPFMHQVQLEIFNCPKLKEWWRRYNLSYNKKEPLKVLFIKSRQQINSWLVEASVLFVENLCILDYDIDFLNTAEWPTFLLLGFYVCSSIHLKRISFSSDLIRLKQLRIWNCPYLENLDGLNYLISLQDMDINNCPNLDSPFLRLHDSLQSLAIDRCNKIFSLTFLGKDLSSLEISSCSTLKSIIFPQRGVSLRFLKISSCPELRLKDEFLPPMITHLEIIACPQLQELCQNHRGTYFQD